MVLHPGNTESVLRAGGVPLILPLLSEEDAYTSVFDKLDGFLLTGSEADVFPGLYGKEPPPDNFSDPLRDAQDFAILRHAEATGKPVFGICRGCQVMNVYRGGTLAIHFSELVKTDIEHNQEEDDGFFCHRVIFSPESDLATLVSEKAPRINSLHRQVCDNLGRGLRIAGRSEDGLIEAIEDDASPTHFFAVQWHPERTPHGPDALSDALFVRLVDAARAS